MKTFLNWTHRWPIRHRLVLLVLALALPFALFLGGSTWNQAASERAHVGQEMLGVARLSAARLDDHIGDIRQLLGVLSLLVDADANSASKNDEILHSVAGRMPPQINDITVWSAEGKLVGTLDPALHGIPINLRKRKFFIDAMQGADLGVEAPLESPLNGEKVAVFAVGIERQGRRVGIVAATARLSTLQNLMTTRSGLSAGAVVTVLDASGTVLARSLDAEHWIGRKVPPQAAPSPDFEEKVIDTFGADGVNRIGAMTVTRRAPWSIYVGIPADVALAGVEQRFVRTILFGGAMLLLGLAAASRIARGISTPLQQLGEHADRLEQGFLQRRIAPSLAQGGEIGRLAGTLDRMSESLAEREGSLQSSRERLQQIADNVPAMISYVDREQRYQFVNDMYRKWQGAQPQAMLGRHLQELIAPEEYALVRHHIEGALAGRRASFQRTIRNADGERHLDVTLLPKTTADGTGFDGFYTLMVDVTAIEQAREASARSEERLRQLAENDALTGLPNRMLFQERLQRAQARSAASGKLTALLFLDIDHFKAVNDTFGHAEGDRLLVDIALTLRNCVRPTDTVARLSGDEFTILLEGLGSADEARAVARDIVQRTRRSIATAAGKVVVSASIGVSVVAPEDFDPATVLKRADAALYDAKRAGRDRFAFSREPRAAGALAG